MSVQVVQTVINVEGVANLLHYLGVHLLNC